MITRSRLRRAAAGSLIAALSLAASAAPAMADGDVYTQSNAPGGNTIQVLDRAGDGSLTPVASVPTGGNGTGAGLGSQGAVTLDDAGRLLYAVNAGSNTVTVFSVRRDGGLRRVDTFGSRGERPVSVAVRGNRVAVLNAGGTPSVATFLQTPVGVVGLPGSTRALPDGAGGPAQVSYTPDGRRLVVTERTANRLDTFRLDGLGRPQAGVVTASSGQVPFGFDITREGFVVVSEAAASTASSYSVLGDGSLSLISASVPTLQGAACWVVATEDGRFAYTANAATGSITAFAVSTAGELTRLAADGRSASSPRPTDIALSADDRVLYALNSAAGEITAYERADDGSLTPIAGAAGMPAGFAGIAAR